MDMKDEQDGLSLKEQARAGSLRRSRNNRPLKFCGAKGASIRILLKGVALKKTTDGTRRSANRGGLPDVESRFSKEQPVTYKRV
jgi:hypothetical protein